MATEKCVVCGADTGIDENTHILARTGYIEGVGQLCIICNKNYAEKELMAFQDFIVPRIERVLSSCNVPKLFSNIKYNYEKENLSVTIPEEYFEKVLNRFTLYFLREDLGKIYLNGRNLRDQFNWDGYLLKGREIGPDEF